MSVSSEKIVALRNDRGWSQHKLSVVSGVSERTIQRVEQDGSTCSLETKLALAAALDVPPPALSPASEEPDLTNAVFDRIPRMSSVQIGIFLLAAYFLIFSGFNFQSSLVLILISLASLFLTSSLISVCYYGAAPTRKLLANLRWNDSYPDNVSKLEATTRQVNTYIKSLYLLGLFLPHLLEFLWSLATLLPGVPGGVLRISMLNTLVPAGYLVVAVVMAEFWLRPYKHKMEKTLQLTA